MVRGRESLTVLAVDDVPDHLERYEHHLGADHDVRTAGDGETALEMVSDEIDVVLLDRDMPGLSGDEVLTRIRDADCDCRVAAVTENDPDDVVDVGYEDALTKPFSESELTTVVERLRRIGEYTDAVRDFHDACECRANRDTADATDEDTPGIDERVTRLRERVDDIATEFDDEDYRVVFRDLGNAH